ncbi:Calcium/calmodulin-dependent protein kinase type 1 [Tritrichomonas foetus]|uniref:Calcium/calmodulin-dependent protein kinase type 1 n=1 Tax=Tritrichomonas foetus TaxID=1144522 RepID=A0A1J4KGT5_9EUKA|nr:Calcium/calmodulin-dependent protein kinase type 1 [Tritrichomonas foetus]|eukprot:OHT08870.1 Calcium/calmodulin-dependent protein kinase type 1 [Tritrichomonas foetus]
MSAENYFVNIQIDRSVGASNFSRVYLSTQRVTGRQIALKVIFKADQESTLIEKEKFLSDVLDSPHLVQISDIFEDVNIIIIKMEYVLGGDLFDWVYSKGTISETGVSAVAHHILLGLKALHSKGIIHRNIKPENILVSESNAGATVKLTDYCLAETIDTNSQLSELSSTEVCSAPEILRGEQYGPEVDVWSVGVILYTLMCGRRPFEEDEKYPLFLKVSSGQYTFDLPEWSIVSDDCKDFIRRMLEVDPAKRITVDEALKHPWLTGEYPDVAMESALKNLQFTIMGRKLKRVMGAAKTASTFRQFTKLMMRSD